MHDHTCMDEHVEPQKKCKQCGDLYEPKAEHQKFCSVKCHDLYWKMIRRVARDLAERGLV